MPQGYHVGRATIEAPEVPPEVGKFESRGCARERRAGDIVVNAGATLSIVKGVVLKAMANQVDFIVSGALGVNGTPHDNLLVSLLNAFGSPVKTFGKAEVCTGPLDRPGPA